MSTLICNNLDSACAGASVSRQVIQTRRLWEENSNLLCYSGGQTGVVTRTSQFLQSPASLVGIGAMSVKRSHRLIKLCVRQTRQEGVGPQCRVANKAWSIRATTSLMISWCLGVKPAAGVDRS
jgi:hypothetical protein